MTPSSDPHSAWQATVAAAVLGTDRSGGTPALPAAMVELSDDAQEPEAMLVRSAALCSVLLRAGAVAAKLEMATSAAPADSGRAPSGLSAGHLRRILDQDARTSPLLREWCATAGVSGRLAPAVLLPELLNRAKRDRGLRPLLEPILGARGRWLAEQKADWRGLFLPQEGDSTTLWETGTASQRLALLEELRPAQPAAARELIESTWEQDAPDERARFLAALLVGLCPDDEPLLERALDDKRKGVRDAAAEGLARLPESGFAKGMLERLRGLIAYEPPARKLLRKTKAELDIQLPPEPDAAARRDGLTAKARGGLGAQAAVLADIVAATPLSFWATFSATPAELLEAALASDYAAALAEGWQQAAFRQRHAAWAEALLRQVLANPGPMRKLGVHPDVRLIGVLPDDRAQAVAMDAMERWPTESVPMLLDQCGAAWSPALSRAVVNWIRLPKLQSDPALRHWLVQSAASRLDPSLAPELAAAWAGELPPAARSAVDELVATLRFRHDLQKELAQ